MSHENYLEINRKGWNQRTAIHVGSKFYDVDSFKAGQCTLPEIDLQDVGDVAGKSMLHLQCHFGLDTMSWARRGADVTGIDLSDEAIGYAQKLSKELNIPAHFINADVFSLPDHLEGQFDLVYTSWGVVGWLPELKTWGKVINHFLKPGGSFHLVEFHPMVYLFDNTGATIVDDYFNVRTYEDEVQGSYTDGDDRTVIKDVSWAHSMADIINALLEQGLQLEFIREYPYQPYNCRENMVEQAPNEWVFEALGTKIPYSLSIKATKPA